MTSLSTALAALGLIGATVLVGTILYGVFALIARFIGELETLILVFIVTWAVLTLMLSS